MTTTPEKKTIVPMFPPGTHLEDDPLLAPHVYTSKLTTGEQITQEIYRDRMERWNWWTPLLLLLLWTIPLTLLSALGIIFAGQIVGAVFLLFLAFIPFWLLRKLRRMFWICYGIFWWHEEGNAFRQQLLCKLRFFTYGWFLERKKTAPPAPEPLTPQTVEAALTELLQDAPVYPVKKPWWHFWRKKT